MLRRRNTTSTKNVSPSEFEWEIGDDNIFATPSSSTVEWQPARPTAPNVSIHFPRGLQWAIPIVVVLLAGALAAMALTQRADSIVAALKQDVLAGYELMRKAITQSDLELFNTLLDYSDAVAARTQQYLFAQDHTLDRSTFGFTLRSIDAQSVSVTLSDDLSQAQVSSEYLYDTPAGNETQHVTLQQISLFRRNGDKWLLTTGYDLFWGRRPIVHHAQRLSLIVPERDALIGQPLALDLDQRVREACATPQLKCPPRFRMTVQLIGNSDIMADFVREGGAILRPANSPVPDFISIVLPAPTLIGLPTDETGYAALRDRYAALIIDQLTTYLQEETSREREGRTRLAVRQLESTDELLQETLIKNDRERFVFLLDTQDETWARAQLNLFDTGQFLDRSAFGLRVNGAERIGASRMYGVGGRQSVYSYTLETASETQSVQLQHTAFYRFDGLRWWLSAPSQEYWGPRTTLHVGSFLQVSVPRRDETLATQLSSLLDTRINQLCKTLDCPATYRVLLQLETDPRLLLSATLDQSIVAFNPNTLLISLPTPALVGRPVNVAGAFALFEGYANIVTHHIRQHLATQ